MTNVKVQMSNEVQSSNDKCKMSIFDFGIWISFGIWILNFELF